MLPKLIPKANFGRKTRKKHYFGRFPLGFGTFGSSVFALVPPYVHGFGYVKEACISLKIY